MHSTSDRADWDKRVANLLGENELQPEWAEKLTPYFQRGIRPPYAAALMRQWLRLPEVT